MYKISINDVSKTLGDIFTLDNISLQVNNNEFVAIIGPSGSGKSTLLNIISGLIMPDRGSIYIDNQDWSGKSGRVGYMQQKDLLLDSRNLLDNVSIPLLLKGIKSKDANKKAKIYLQDFGLIGFESYYPNQLSGGMRQRAALLRTFLFASDIMLLDEPFAGLDAITRSNMHHWLNDIYKQYKPSILLVTHDIDEALFLADKIYVLSQRPAKILCEHENPINQRQNIDYISATKTKILNLLE